MKRTSKNNKQLGQALAEIVLLLPIGVLFLLGVIEVSNAINTYITIIEASRGGARLIVYQGNTNGVDTHVQNAAQRLPSSRLVTIATQGIDAAGKKKYTVEVQYDYRPILNNVPILSTVIPNPLRFVARTTMPVP